MFGNKTIITKYKRKILFLRIIFNKLDTIINNIMYSTFSSVSSLQQQMRVTRHRVLAKFGLMHMIGTNLSVWLNVLVQETKHEILTFYNPADNSIGVDKQPNHFSRKSIQTDTEQYGYQVPSEILTPN